MPDRKAPPPPPAGGWTRREFIERVAGVTAGIACAGTLAGQIAACREGEADATPGGSPDGGVPDGGGAAAGAAPYILLITTDQEQQPRWIGGEALLRERLPARSWLKRHGVEFTNAHCNTLPCSPSRATLYAGLYAPQHHVYGNCGMDGNFLHGFPTCASILKERYGYRTYYCGKSHLSSVQEYPCGDDKRDGMTPYGFDEWITAPTSKPSENGDLWPEGLCYDSVGYPHEGSHEDESFARQFLDWLDRPEAKEPGDKPWFAVLSLVNPHDIMFYPRFEAEQVEPLVDARPANWERREDLERCKPTCQAEYVALYNMLGGLMPEPRLDAPNAPANAVWDRMPDAYRALMEENDRDLEAVLERLLSLHPDVRDNLVVLFTSDHGELLGAHGQRAKGPCMYEEQMNVPLYVVDFSSQAIREQVAALDLTGDPAPTAGGRFVEELGARRTALVGLLDVTPTLVSLGAAGEAEGDAGWRAAHPQLQGGSLLPLLRAGQRDAALLVPDPARPDDPGADSPRHHLLATCDQGYSLPVGEESRIDVTTAPHVVSLRKETRDASGAVTADYKLNLYYFWEVDPADGLTKAEPGQSRPYVDWERPYQAELYDMTAPPELLEVGNLVPPDLPREDENGEVDGQALQWPPKYVIRNGERREESYGEAERSEHRRIYDEKKAELVGQRLDGALRRPLPTEELRAIQDAAWERYRTGGANSDCQPLDVGDRHVDCVGL